MLYEPHELLKLIWQRNKLWNMYVCIYIYCIYIYIQFLWLCDWDFRSCSFTLASLHSFKY